MTTMNFPPQSTTLDIERTDHPVSIARRHASTTFSDWDIPPDLVYDALVVVSELVTNALAHTAGDVRLELSARARADRPAVWIGVRDTDTDMHGTARGAAPDAESGRGLDIVCALAVSHGSASHDGSKTVWAEIVEADADEQLPATAFGRCPKWGTPVPVPELAAA